MSSFTLKQGDTSPALEYTLTPADTVLVGASAQFHMSDWKGRSIVDRAAVIYSDQNPAVLGYEWQEADTEDVGQFRADFLVTFADGTQETFPNAGFIAVQIGRRAKGISE